MGWKTRSLFHRRSSQAPERLTICRGIGDGAGSQLPSARRPRSPTALPPTGTACQALRNGLCDGAHDALLAGVAQMGTHPRTAKESPHYRGKNKGGARTEARTGAGAATAEATWALRASPRAARASRYRDAERPSGLSFPFSPGAQGPPAPPPRAAGEHGGVADTSPGNRRETSSHYSRSATLPDNHRHQQEAGGGPRGGRGPRCGPARASPAFSPPRAETPVRLRDGALTRGAALGCPRSSGPPCLLDRPTERRGPADKEQAAAITCQRRAGGEATSEPRARRTPRELAP